LRYSKSGNVKPVKYCRTVGQSGKVSKSCSMTNIEQLGQKSVMRSEEQPASQHVHRIQSQSSPSHKCCQVSKNIRPYYIKEIAKNCETKSPEARYKKHKGTFLQEKWV
jgi:hypothetical protein